MPDFTIRGNPAAIRSRAATTRAKGQLFFDTGDALAKISVDGWTGRAADHFRDKHDLEPDRWSEAGNGFLRAGSALDGYAAAVEDAQRRAAWAEGEHARGDEVSASARSSYDADVARAREEQSNAVELGGTMTLTILPFDDPGQAIRQGALDELASARADLDAAAHTCADEVRRGCADAPEEAGWLESGLRFVGGVLEGAGEALWDLATLTPFSPINMLQDLTALATGDLTPEELMSKYQLSLETAQGMLDALVEDPVGFGKELGKGLLDWDTWADDPARALGHLVPDAVVAVLTAGSGTAATRGVGSIDDVADGLTAINRLDDAAALGRLDDLGELGDLGRLDDLGDLSRLDDLGDLSRTYAMMDDVPHTTSFAPEQLGTGNVDGLLLQHGVTRDELIDLVNTPTDALTDAQRATLNAVRDDLPVPDGDTVMQKVVSQPHFDADGNLVAGGADDYVLGARDGFDVTEVRGSVTVADESSQLGTPQQVHDGLRLDYDGSPFTPDDSSVHVIRFQADSATPAYEIPRNADMGGGGATRYDSWDDPFTGNGFTKAGDDIVPEVYTPGVNVRDGAEMWEVLDDGTQRLVAVLRDKTWIPQGN